MINVSFSNFDLLVNSLNTRVNSKVNTRLQISDSWIPYFIRGLKVLLVINLWINFVEFLIDLESLVIY